MGDDNNKKVEVSFIELENSYGNIYKVTRRITSMAAPETRIFRKKADAVKQFNEWLANYLLFVLGGL
ncbi:hypothetical protein J4231_00735 [Candidatus Woesearchaeota archaeon]|nr:hypothetical protein [Candidatus Woesearchaeota archaeon]